MVKNDSLNEKLEWSLLVAGEAVMKQDGVKSLDGD